MPRFAVVCPGQGILAKGCLAPLRNHLSQFRPILDCADQVLGENFSAHLLADPPKEADPWSLATANAQPAIVTATYVTHHLLRQLHGVDLARHPRVSHLLGHSLGEYTALLLSGVLDLEAALRIVRRRGELMQLLVGRARYGMHVLVFRPRDFDAVVAAASGHGVLACVNNRTQILISGELEALDAAVAAMDEGTRRVLRRVPLPVTIPFHHPVLAPVEDTLLQLPGVLGAWSRPIVANVTGEPAPAGATAPEVYANTVRANSRPVQWKRSMEYLEEKGVDLVISLGPGAAVDAINSRFGVTNHPLKTVEDMAAVARALGD